MSTFGGYMKIIIIALLSLSFSVYGIDTKCTKKVSSLMEDEILSKVFDVFEKSFRFESETGDIEVVKITSTNEGSLVFGHRSSIDNFDVHYKLLELCSDNHDRMYFATRKTITGFEMLQLTEIKILPNQLLIAEDSFMSHENEEDYISFPFIVYNSLK